MKVIYNGTPDVRTFKEALSREIPELLERYKGELALKTDLEQPYFVYEKKRIQKNVKNPNSIEVVKNVLFGLKGLIEN